jgi:hypothetical protein
MKNNLKLFGFIAFIVVIGFSMIACGGDNKLSGTWESAPMYEYDATISFSGKKFTITEYPAFDTNDYWWGWMSDSFSGRDRNWYKGKNEQFTLIKTEWGTEIYKNVMDGTYSISDDKIELSYPDGEIKVLSFSRTENTITIGGSQLKRKK